MKMFDARKTSMIGLRYGEKNYDNMFSRFHTIPACHGQTDGLTYGLNFLLCQYRASLLTRDKNEVSIDVLQEDL